MKLPKIGNLAPSFSLPDQDENIIKLSNYKNKKNVVLYFYPKAMTPGCTVQACGIRDSKAKFSKVNTVVFGISPDKPDKLKKFEDKYDLNFTLLADEGHKIADEYGVWGLKKFLGKEYMGIMRMTFIISKDGKLAHIMEKVKTKTHDDDVYEYIKANL